MRSSYCTFGRPYTTLYHQPRMHSQGQEKNKTHQIIIGFHRWKYTTDLLYIPTRGYTPPSYIKKVSRYYMLSCLFGTLYLTWSEHFQPLENGLNCLAIFYNRRRIYTQYTHHLTLDKTRINNYGSSTLYNFLYSYSLIYTYELLFRTHIYSRILRCTANTEIRIVYDRMLVMHQCSNMP